MKKYAKKLLALAMVLAMVLSLGVSAMAFTDGNGAKLQVALENAPTVSGEVTVYLSIVSDRVYDSNGNYVQIERYNLPVTIGETGTTATYYVSDVLLAAKDQYSWLDFYTASGAQIQDHIYSVYGVKDSAVSSSVIFQPAEYDYMDVEDWFDVEDYMVPIYAYMQYVCNGWMFRINNQIPLLNHADWPANPTQSEYGALINEAYVVNGDHVFLYFADIYEGMNYDETGTHFGENVYATRYLKLNNIVYDDDYETVSVDLLASRIITDYSLQWDLSYVDYVTYNGLPAQNPITVGVRIDGVLMGTPSIVNGHVVIDLPDELSTGSHTLEIVPDSILTHTVEGTTYGFNSYVGFATFTVTE